MATVFAASAGAATLPQTSLKPVMRYYSDVCALYLKLRYADKSPSEMTAHAGRFTQRNETFFEHDESSIKTFAGAERDKFRNLADGFSTVANDFANSALSEEKQTKDGFDKSELLKFWQARMTRIARLSQSYSGLHNFLLKHAYREQMTDLTPAAYYMFAGPKLFSPEYRRLDGEQALVSPDPDLPGSATALHFVYLKADLDRTNADLARHALDNDPSLLASIRPGFTVYALRANGSATWTDVADWRDLTDAALGLSAGKSDFSIEILIGLSRASATPLILCVP